MYDHLLNNGITRNYVQWLMHEEYEFYEPTNAGNTSNSGTNESNMHDEMKEMLNNAFRMSSRMRNLKEVHMFMRSLNRYRIRI